MKPLLNKNIERLGYIVTPTGVLALLTAFCISLIATSYVRSSNITYFFLAWNLFLAWVPLFFAILWRHRMSYGKLKKWKAFIIFSLWLLFFPNSPYLITDLVHLNNRFNPAIWADTLLLFSCALAGLVLGIYSLHIVHQLIKKYVNNPGAWCVICISLLLSGYGIYLGRVQRWNSWDLFTNPIALLSDSLLQLHSQQALKMTIGFSALLFIIYFMLQTILYHERIKKQPEQKR